MKKILLVFVFLFSITYSNAYIPLRNGNYKGKQLTTDGYTIKCGWKKWEDCVVFDPVHCMLLFGNDHLPLRVQITSNPDATPQEVYDYLIKHMSSGSVNNPETNEMETWTTFTGITLTEK
jgi:hypothetical protein